MFMYKDCQQLVTCPAKVEYDGFIREFSSLTREQWDEIGYNEAIPAKREPFTRYETRWEKGDDLIYRETILSMEVDEAARSEKAAQTVRAQRDDRLVATDWTQLMDTPLNEQDMVLWQSYRQALRDVPQQAEFPDEVEWPEMPARE